MGHLIEEIARDKKHKIVSIIDIDNIDAFESKDFKSADVAIEFSTPSSAVENILRCFAAGVPVVVGTTGWLNSLPELKALCENGKGTMMYASNFSIGVNIFMALNRYMGKIMNDFPAYTPALTEIHHIHKLDHPSGTAITLAEELIEVYKGKDSWMEPTPDSPAKRNQLPVDHIREGEIPGTHIISWDSEVDKITLTHEAKSRKGFAEGAVRAAEWLEGRKGFFSMSEMLSDITGTSELFI